MTQNETILAALKEGPLTAWDAIQRFGITRLSARIYELRHRGFQIKAKDKRVGDGKRVAEYILDGHHRRPK